MDESGRRCFAHVTDEDLFVHSKFDVKIISARSFNSYLLTTAARVRNAMAQALADTVTPVPKLIFIMLEDDVIKQVRNFKNPDDLAHIYGRNIEWLFHETRKMIAGHLDALPLKARREPYIVWVLPTRHMNYANDYKREIFGKVMENIVEIHNEKNLALGFRQNWDRFDPSIFYYDSQRYSDEGLSRVWKAFDRTVWYANVLVDKAEYRKNAEKNGSLQRNLNNNQGGVIQNTFQPRGGTRGRGTFRSAQRGNSYFAHKKQYSKAGRTARRMPPPPDM